MALAMTTTRNYILMAMRNLGVSHNFGQERPETVAPASWENASTSSIQFSTMASQYALIDCYTIECAIANLLETTIFEHGDVFDVSHRTAMA